jgi:hypothetical protein
MSFHQDFRNSDLETRQVAIDALGNFFKATSVSLIESIPYLHFSEGNHQSDSLSPAFEEIHLLQRLLGDSLDVLVVNLQLCETHISSTADWFEGIRKIHCESRY